MDASTVADAQQWAASLDVTHSAQRVDVRRGAAIAREMLK